MVTPFDRSKFKGAKLSANKDSQKSAQENNKSFGNDGVRVGFLTIDEGKNVFRILPPHPDDTIGAAYLPKRVSTLQCEVPVYKDGEDTGKTEVKAKNIFIATQHGGLPKDPIELYIDYVRKRANDEFQDKEDRAKFLYPITGYRGPKGDWNWGISPKTTFVAYAIKDKKMGRLELYESMIKDMNKAAITEDAEDVIEIDPFSDPNEGCELIITKQKQHDKQGKEINKWEFPITKGEPSRVKRESWDEYFERTMVTDDQLAELLKQEPLSKIMGNNVYTSRDFDFAIDGLHRLDDLYKFNIFENSEFLDELEQIQALIPEYKKDDKDIEAAFDPKKKKNTEKDQSQETDQSTDDDQVSIEEMKTDLRKVIKKQFGIEYLDQLPKKESDIEKWYCMIMEGTKLPIKMEEETQAPEPIKPKEATHVNEEGADTSAEVQSQIDKLRNRGRRA